MAGNPKKAAVRAELERRTQAEFPDEPEATLLDYVCHWLADGQTFRALCRDIKSSAPVVYTLLNHDFGADNVKAAFAKARELGSHQLVDESIEIADNAVPMEAAKANLQVRARQWAAERWNRKDLGVDRGGAASVNISIGQLMMGALLAPPPPREVEESKSDVLPRAQDTAGRDRQLEAGGSASVSAIASAIAEEAEVLSIEPATSSPLE